MTPPVRAELRWLHSADLLDLEHGTPANADCFCLSAEASIGERGAEESGAEGPVPDDDEATIAGSAIAKTILGGGDPIGDPDGFLRTTEQYARLGVDLVEIMPNVPDPVAMVSEIGEKIVPRPAEVG